MADEAASLVVRITGDAAQLESTINSVAGQLQGLEKSGGGVSANTQKAIDKVTKSTQSYADVVNSSKKNVEDKKKALKEAEAEYTKTKKSVDESAKSLKGEQTQLDELNKTLEDAKQKRNDAAKAVKSASEEYEVLSKNLDKVTALEKSYNLQDSGKRWKDTGDAINTVTKPLQTTSLLLAAGGVAAAKFAMDFEDNFAAVEKTVDGTPEQLEAVKQGIIDLTTTGIDGRSALPMTTAELTALAAAGGQLGISTENIVEFTEVMAQMGTATNLVGEEGAATLARFMNVMQIPQGEIRNIGSAVVDLGNNMATTEAEIMEMSNRMGKYGQTVGMGAADVMGYSAALSSLGVEAQLGGSAVGRTWLSIETAVAAGGKKLQAFAKYSGKSAAEFKKQWETDASGAFMDLLKGLGEAKNLTLALGEVGINNTQDIQAIMSMASNYELVAEAIGLSNTAYKENIALQTEADKKAETTASQWQITKNNLVETGRSFGEILLPSIKDATGSIAGFAQKLASLDEGTKKGIVNVAAGVAGLGAMSKMAVGATKGIGTLIEGYGKLTEKWPAITKLGPAILKGIASPAGIATLAVVGLGIAGKKASDAWYKSAHLWADGMSEQAEAITASVNKLTSLNSLKKEIGDLKLVIKSKDSSKEELEAAEARLQEIAGLLGTEYNLVINTDDSDIDETIDKLEKAVKILSDEERKQRNDDVTDHLESVGNNIEKYKEAQANISGLKATAETKKNDWYSVSGFKNSLSLLKNEYDNGLLGADEYIAKAQNIARQAVIAGLGDEIEVWSGLGKGGFDPNEIDNIYGVSKFLENLEDTVGGLETEFNTASAAVDETQAQIDEFDESTQKAGNSLSQMLASDIATGNSENIRQDIELFEGLGERMEKAGADTDKLSMQFATAKTGFADFNTAIKEGKADEMAQSYMDFKESIGASAEEGVQGAALIKNGFSSASDAIAKGDDAVKAVLTDLKGLAKAEGIDVTNENLTKMAEAMGLIPKYTEITIDAEGNIELVDRLNESVKSINETGGITLKVNADGDAEIEAVNEKMKAAVALKEQLDKGLITIKFNAETEGFDIFNLSGVKTGEITKEGKIDWGIGELKLPEEKDTKADGKINYNDYEIGEKSKPPIDEITVTGKVNYTYGSVMPPLMSHQAHGTQNFPGGLAMVNDERGVADPRELVIDKGQAFIPQGRDVILPLSKGAKVYTATQTKNIMSSLGIPRYAKGKSNSDAFTTARDNWSHYTKTHAVTVSEELEKWVEFSKQFKGNLKDVEDIEEQIFSLVKKQNQELNKMSEDYINIRTMLNDWEAVGDDPLSAYKRVEERNLASLNAGQLTEAEFNDIMTDFADNMLEGRIDQSFDWLDREQKYNNMTTEEYIAGLDRMIAYTNQAYADMAISEETYHEIMTNLTDKRRDAEIKAAEEAVDAWKKSADNWITIRETFNDWEDVGDSKSDFYLRSLGSIEKLYRNGDLGWEEYMDMSQEAYLNFYKAEEERLDTELDEFRDMIDETESKFREEEQALRDSWTVEDRETDKAEVERLLGIYENSVTEAGQKKYKELLEQKKEIEREEELYNLEQDHKEILEKYEAEYLEKEEDKAQYLKTLHTDSFNIFSKTVDIDTGVDNIKKTLETASTNNNTVLTRLAEVLEDLEKKDTNTYNDGRNITINSGMSGKEISGVIGSTVVSGFGDILITR